MSLHWKHRVITTGPSMETPPNYFLIPCWSRRTSRVITVALLNRSTGCWLQKIAPILSLHLFTPFTMWLYSNSHQEVKPPPSPFESELVWANRKWQRWHCAHSDSRSQDILYVSAHSLRALHPGHGGDQATLLEAERPHGTELTPQIITEAWEPPCQSVGPGK